MTNEQTPEVIPTVSFADLGLSENLLKALLDMKPTPYTNPSPIQEKTIPLLLEGKDIIAQAQTGTGKTAAFLLPILHRLDSNSSATQALIIAPTRELANQITDQLELLSKYIRVTFTTLCGGQAYKPQLDQLRSGAQIVIGTPGRILDHLVQRKTLKLDRLSTFVLDEADEMLKMGFIDDIETILATLPAKKQVALFSATMPTPIRKIANTYLNKPESVEIKSETATVKMIEQRCAFVGHGQKNAVLHRLLAVENFQNVIVFVRTKASTDEVATFLINQGYRAEALNGDLSQPQREQIVAKFRQGTIEILVATDIAARGLDVERITHVINYDVSHDSETYVHRIGRTGRAGRSGVAILLLNNRERRTLDQIERHTRQSITIIDIPTNEMIQQAREERLVEEIKQRLEHKNIDGYREIIERFTAAHPDASMVDIAAALALISNKDKPWKQHLPEVKAVAAERRSMGSSNGRDSFGSSNNKFGKKRPNRPDVPTKNYDAVPQILYRLDVGKVHGVKPGNIVGAIANEAGIQSRYITGIKINDDHTTVRLPKDLPKEAYQGLQKAWVCGRQLKLTEIAFERA